MKYLKYFEMQRSYNIDEIVKYYLEAALWTEQERLEEDLEDNDFTIYSFSDDDKKVIKEEIEWFISNIGDSINLMTDDQLGYDLWLTRNGHGAGFFDRNYPKKDEQILNKLCDELGFADIYVGDDNNIYYESCDKYKEFDVDKWKKEMKFRNDVNKYNL
jgi:hypothetical protein